MDKNKKILYVVLAFVILGGLSLLLSKSVFNKKNIKPQKLRNKRDFIEGNNPLVWNVDSQSLSTSPKTQVYNYDILIVFGGIGYATPEYMEESIPNSIKENYLIFYYPYTEKVDAKFLDFIQKLKESDLKPRSISFAGFSAGGKNVMKAMQIFEYRKIHNIPIIKYILIDPSIDKSIYKTLDYSQAVMAYGSNGMVNLYANEYYDLESIINQQDGVIDRQSLSHSDFIPYIFQNHIE